MRRGKKVELGAFSVSAIDLFACALGAFIVLTLVLFPYFPNLDNLRPILEQLRAEKADLEDALGEQVAQNNALSAQNAAQAAQISSQQQQIASQQQQLDAAISQARGAAFLGIQPTSDYFQLVIDLSGSIQEYEAEVESSVALILGRLEESQHLRIVTFQGPTNNPTFHFWPSQNAYASGLTDAVKSQAFNFVDNILTQAGSFTPTFEVMDLVASTGTPSSIFLITDGIPSVGSREMNRQEITAATNRFTASNSGRHQVNIVAIGSFITSDISSAILPLATENGGTMVAVPKR